MQDKPHNLIEVIEFTRKAGLPAEVVGRWVWVRFDEKPSEETRQALKDFGFRWVKSRGMWAHNCGHPSKHGQQHPWRKYGHVPVGDIDTEALTAA